MVFLNMSQQLDTVLKLIDQANSEDPNMEQDLNGQNQPISNAGVRQEVIMNLIV